MFCSIPPQATNATAFSPQVPTLETDFSLPASSPGLGNLYKVWSATGKLDNLWYQLQRPDIAALQQFVNHALQDMEQIQVIATVVVAAERILRALDTLKRIECTLRHLRRTWNVPGADFYSGFSYCEQTNVLQRMCAKLYRLTKICWLLLGEIFQLAMYLVDVRESLTWNEQNRKERVRHMVVDIARLCQHASLIRESLRGEQELVDWWLVKIGSPLRAERLYFILNQVDQFC